MATVWRMALYIAGLVILVAYILRMVYIHNIAYFTRPSVPTEDRSADGFDDLCTLGRENTLDPQYRVEFGVQASATVYGWPKEGGLLVLNPALNADMEYLGLQCFVQVKRPEKRDVDAMAEEEAHCEKLRKLGANWYDSEDSYINTLISYRHRSDRFVRYGWPSNGGVWVLNVTIDDAAAKGAGRLYYTNTMDEKCEVIKLLGGIYHKDSEAVSFPESGDTEASDPSGNV